ncbi:MAG TPA: mannose-1-phosphate guanylyltransferase, partial [Spongiibacteraceae bacterium]|nr:mannose-1-phosphate guanylyltransferase [Spongiibacteraceae bacterium]
GCAIAYSREGSPLDTGGGIFRALPLLGDEPFVTLNADVWTDYPLENLISIFKQRKCRLAHLVLATNPPQHLTGDFYLHDDLVSEAGEGGKLTLSGISLIDPALFANCSDGVFSIVPLLKRAMGQGKVSGEHYGGRWFDIGTPERLREINELVASNFK